MYPVPTGCASHSPTHSRQRLYLVKAFSALALLLLVPSARAQSGSYTLVGPTGGKTSAAPQPGPPPRPYGSVQGGYGGTVGYGTYTPDGSASVNCAGEIDQVYTWQGSDTPPQSIIVTQTCTASCQSYTSRLSGAGGSPSCDDGFQDSPTVTTTVVPPAPTAMSGTYVNAVSTGTHYKVMSGGASFTVSCTPSASIGVSSGNCGAGVTYSGTATPVTIQLTGVTTDHKLLTGQQCTATLSGTNGYTVKSYTWSVGGKAFKNYDITKTNNDQLVALDPKDLTGPATGSTSVAPVSFYDGKQESLNVSCTASVTAPDGTSLSVSAKAPQITVLKPSASWTAQGSFVDLSSKSGAYAGNEIWHPVTITVPQPFSGGTACFAQIVTPQTITVTRTPQNGKPNTYSAKVPDGNGGWVAPGTGLDGGFPYLNGFTVDSQGNPNGAVTNGYTFSPGTTGYSGDSPKGAEGGVPDVDGGGTNWTSSTASASFVTYLMYKPAGNNSVYVPLQSLTWSWTGSASVSNGTWTATGSVSSPGSGVDTNDPLQWSSVISGQQYRP